MPHAAPPPVVRVRPPSAVLLLALVLVACQGHSGAREEARPAPGSVPAPASEAGPVSPPSGALLHEDFERGTPDGPPPDWTAVPLGDAPATRWTLVEEGGNRVLRGQADAAASGLARPLDGPAGSLSWRWRVEALADGPRDERSRAGDDFAARVLVTFASRPGAGLADSLQDAAARLAGHEQVPAAAVAYVIARDLPAGSHFVSPYTERVHTFVIRGADDDRQAWHRERRDLAADFLEAFGGPAPAVTGLQLLTDSDDAGGTACALYDDLLLLPPTDG